MSESGAKTTPLQDYFAGTLVTTSLMSSLRNEVDVSDVIADAEQQINELMRAFVEGVHRVTQQTALHVLARQLGAAPAAKQPMAKQPRPRFPRLPTLVQSQPHNPESDARMALIATTLKAIRAKLELTQKQMAARVGCSQSNYTQWECQRIGRRGLKAKFIAAINVVAREAGVTPLEVT